MQQRHSRQPRRPALFRSVCRLAVACVWALSCVQLRAAEQTFQPEIFLPEDTIAFVTTPQAPKAFAFLGRTPYGRLWNDPLLKPFRDNFCKKFDQHFLKTFREEFGIGDHGWKSLFKDSATIALTQDGWDAKSTNRPGWIAILDSGPGTTNLQARLATMRNHWQQKTGKPARHCTIAGHPFSVFEISTNSALHQVDMLLPVQLVSQQLITGAPTNSHGARKELFVGQVNALLIVGTSQIAIDKVVTRISGRASPVLADQPSYKVCHNHIFTNAVFRIWLNPKPLLEGYRTAALKSTPASPDALDPANLIQSSGLTALKSIGFAAINATNGCRFELLLNVPENERQGLLRLFAGKPGDTSVPAWVPANAVRFQRWRMEGLNAWNTFQEMMSQISTQWTGTTDFILNTANEAARLKEPGFDVRSNLLGNLGDDFIKFSKVPRPGAANQEAGPSLLAVSSRRPEQVAAALQRILIFLSAEAENPVQREFQGHRIYSVPLPPVPLPFETLPSVPPGRTLHYTATSNYVAISTDAGLIEEFLRGPGTNTAALKNLPGLREAVTVVSRPATSLLLYENQSALVRPGYEAERSANTSTNQPRSLVPAALGLAKPSTELQRFFEFSLLPPFDQVSKHFSFFVRASEPSPHGILVQWFIPDPPAAPK